jgi:hypothetical protein
MKLLQRAERANVLSQLFMIIIVRFISVLNLCRPLAKIDGVAFLHPKIVGTDFHYSPFLGGAPKGDVTGLSPLKRRFAGSDQAAGRAFSKHQNCFLSDYDRSIP